MSRSVVSVERLNLTAPRADSSVIPMASRTCDGSSAPLLHADPAPLHPVVDRLQVFVFHPARLFDID